MNSIIKNWFSIHLCSICRYISSQLFTLLQLIGIHNINSQDIYETDGLDASNKFNVSINESSGTFSQDIKRSIGRFLLQDDSGITGSCSCTLVNTVKQDRTPYILTAAHCLENQNVNDKYEAYFSFDYEMPNDKTVKRPDDEFITGLWKVAYEIVLKNENTDIALLKLKNPPSELLENVYAAGWDNTLNNQFYENISHPEGDHKKIWLYSII